MTNSKWGLVNGFKSNGHNVYRPPTCLYFDNIIYLLNECSHYLIIFIHWSLLTLPDFETKWRDPPFESRPKPNREILRGAHPSHQVGVWETATGRHQELWRQKGQATGRSTGTQDAAGNQHYRTQGKWTGSQKGESDKVLHLGGGEGVFPPRFCLRGGWERLFRISFIFLPLTLVPIV